jgi:predicted nucleic acid-binding protein
MNGETLILDTNVVIGLLDDEEKSYFLDESFPGNTRGVSIITQIELLGYPDITEEADKLIRSFLDNIPIVSIDTGIVETAVQIRRARQGIKLPDAIIAATAIVLNGVLVTNDGDLLKLNFSGLTTQHIP